MKKEIIVYTDDKAAQLKTVTGWVSSDGRFWGKDEHMARYAGCTHVKCECGNIMERSWTKCQECRRKGNLEKYNSFPVKEWNGKDPICTYDGGIYFFTEEDLEDYCEDNEIAPEELMLVFCKENNLSRIDFGYWADSLPEDHDLEDCCSKEFIEKVEELNAIIRKHKAVSYSPGKVRVAYKLDNDEK